MNIDCIRQNFKSSKKSDKKQKLTRKKTYRYIININGIRGNFENSKESDKKQSLNIKYLMQVQFNCHPLKL